MVSNAVGVRMIFSLLYVMPISTNDVSIDTVTNQDTFISAEKYHDLCCIMKEFHVRNIIYPSKCPLLCSTITYLAASFI